MIQPTLFEDGDEIEVCDVYYMYATGTPHHREIDGYYSGFAKIEEVEDDDPLSPYDRCYRAFIYIEEDMEFEVGIYQAQIIDTRYIDGSIEELMQI